MKKVILLMLMLLLAACGGGGGGGNTVSGDGASGSSATGVVALQFVDGTHQASASKAFFVTDPTRGRVRVLIKNASYSKIADIPFGSDATIALPVGTGYSAEAFYYENGSIRRLTQHGKSTANFDVQSGTATAAQIPMTDLKGAVAITPPTGPVYAGATYAVGAPDATALGLVGLQSAWSLAVKVSATAADPFTGAVHLAATPTAVHSAVAAPLTDTPGYLHFQGEFFIKTEMLQAGESANDWTFSTQPDETLEASHPQLLIPNLGGLVGLPPDGTAPTVANFSVPATKVGSLTVPVTITATDNAGIAGYMITESATAPTSATDSRWQASLTSYPCSGTLTHGIDREVHLWAWVKDFAGNISAANTASADKKVILNDSPTVTTFTVPSTTQFSTAVPGIAIAGKSNTGTNSSLSYLITTADTPAPTAATSGWAAVPAAGSTVSYTVPALTQVAGQRYNVTLYVWVKDGFDSVSTPLNNTVTISDVPQVTAFSVPLTVATGSDVPISSFQGTAADVLLPDGVTHNAIAGYAITTTPAAPAVGAFTATAPTSYHMSGLISGVAVTKGLYAWVIDSRNFVSLARIASVRFSAP